MMNKMQENMEKICKKNMLNNVQKMKTDILKNIKYMPVRNPWPYSHWQVTVTVARDCQSGSSTFYAALDSDPREPARPGPRGSASTTSCYELTAAAYPASFQQYFGPGPPACYDGIEHGPHFDFQIRFLLP
jgi:hypothetical protein